MKRVKWIAACIALVFALPAWSGMNDDPEMSKISPPEGREQPPAGIDQAELIEVIATVTAVDMANRLVTIMGPEGNSVVIQVTEQVKNLPNVEVGDKVRIEYYRSAFVDIVTDTKGVDMETEVSGARLSAPEGQKPAGAVGVELVRRAEVMFVDPVQQYIKFLSKDRGLRTISLKDSPDLQHYLKELKKGDIVQVTYTEALGISLEPAE